MTTFNYPFLTADEIKKKRNILYSIVFCLSLILISIVMHHVLLLLQTDTVNFQFATFFVVIIGVLLFSSFEKIGYLYPLDNPRLIKQLTALCQEFPEVEQYRQRVIQVGREFTLGEFNYITQWCDEQKDIQKQQSIKNKLYQP